MGRIVGVVSRMKDLEMAEVMTGVQRLQREIFIARACDAISFAVIHSMICRWHR
jgi:hypothetical protein